MLRHFVLTKVILIGHLCNILRQLDPLKLNLTCPKAGVDDC